MADYNLGRAEGEIALKYKPGGPAAAEKDLNRVEKSSKSAGASMDRTGTRMALAGAAIAGGLALAVNAAANFEQRLSGIKAVTGATESQMEAVRKKALQLGQDTKFSASEAAQAIEELAKAGISLPDIMNGAADATVALAAAGEIALPRAAEIAANAMNVFNLKASDMPKVADLIAGAANASAISVDEFAQSLQQSGAAANLAGFGFEDLATAIALMGNAGIKGSDAGTSLKTMFLNLNPTTKKQIALMKELGIVTKDGGNQFFDAKGKAKSLADIAGILQNALKGMTDQQKLAALETLFGSDAIRAAAVVSKAGTAGFENMSKAMNKVKAADVAATRMDNLKGSIEQMRGSLETAAIQLGTILIPSLRAMVDNLTRLINAFSNLSPATQAMIVNILKAVAALLLFMGATIKVVRFVGDFVRAMQAIAALKAVAPILRGIAAAARIMWAALTGPVGLVIVAILAVIAIIVLLYKKNETFRNAVNATWQWIKNNIPPIARAIWSAILAAWTAIVNATTTAFNAVRNVVTSVWNAIVTAFQVGRAAVMAAWNAVWIVIGPVVKIAFAIVVGVIKAGMAIIGAAVRIGMAIVKTGFAIFQTIVPIVLGVLNIIRLAFVLAFQVIKVIVLAAMVAIYLAIKVGMAIIQNVVLPVLRLILAGFKMVWSAVSAVVRAAMNTARSAISAGMNAIRGIVTSVLNAIRSLFNAIMGSAIGQAVRRGISSVLGAMRKIGEIVGIAAAAVGRTVAAIASGMGRVVSAIASGVGRAAGAIRGLAGSFFSAGVAIINSLIGGITSRIQGAISAVSGLAGKLRGLLPGSPVKEGPLKVLNRGHAGKQIVNMLIDGIKARGSDLAAAVASVSLPVATLGMDTGAALAASAARTATGGVMAAAPAASGPTADALASAVMRGLESARFEIDKDGLARIVSGSLIPTFAMGGQA